MPADDGEDKIVENMETLRINFSLRQWRVCALICDALADKFKEMGKSGSDQDRSTSATGKS